MNDNSISETIMRSCMFIIISSIFFIGLLGLILRIPGMEVVVFTIGELEINFGWIIAMCINLIAFYWAFSD